MAIKEDGSLWAWGSDGNGLLGNGDEKGSSTVPTKVMDNVKAVVSGDYNVAIIKKDGSLWVWGSNEYGEMGNGTRGIYSHIHTPQKVMDGVIDVAVGAFHIAAVKQDGSLWIWGSNQHGALGDKNVLPGGMRTKPIKIMDDVVEVEANSFNTMAIKQDGSLWGWGNNMYGQLGDGTYEDKYEPVRVMEDVLSISMDQYTMIVKKDGTLWGCGDNREGVLGKDVKAKQLEFEKLMSDVRAVSVNGFHAAVIKKDNSLWMVGNNGWGQFGLGEKGRTKEFEKVLDDVSEVTAEKLHTAIIKTDGSLWASGDNEYGQLGDGTKEDRLSFVKIMDGARVLYKGVVQGTKDIDKLQDIDKKKNISIIFLTPAKT